MADSGSLCGIYAAALMILLASSSMAASKPMKGVYYPSWSTVDPSSIKTKLYTHIYYAFLTPHSDNFTFQIHQSTASTLLNFTSTFHAANPPLTTLFSVGGAAEGTALFTRLVSTSASRSAFVHSSIDVARKLGFVSLSLL